MDLDVNHYTLVELLNLFKLPVKYGADDLKNAKKIVHKTHPDKSGLDPAYFLFFSKAYAIVCQVHKMKTNQVEADPLEDDAEKKRMAAEFMAAPNFREEFNRLFERSYLRSEEEADGHGDWLKSSADLGDSYEERKRLARALVVTPECAASSFRGDGYADLKHVYTTGSVVGVSETLDLPASRTAEQLKFERSKKIDPMSRSECDRYWAEAEEREEGVAANKAYDMVRQSLKQEEKLQGFWTHLLRNG